jgi:hypothetical protein
MAAGLPDIRLLQISSKDAFDYIEDKVDVYRYRFYF